MSQDNAFYLRAARLEDMQLIYEWANDFETRKNSFSTDPITLDEHRTWYTNLLNSHDSKLFIMVYEGNDVGQVRIKIEGNSAEISYGIASDFRCMGYGKILLSLIAKKVKEEFPEIKTLIAQVKPENIASQKALVGMGYVEKCHVYQLELEKANKIASQTTYNGGGGVLFLTNNYESADLFDWINMQGVRANLFSEAINVKQLQLLKPKLIISYNYRHIIKKDVIEYMNGRIINLHISLLPWNKGASPNIWSFFENTPKGVTIHQVDEGLDTGYIIYQKECFFDILNETFASTYQKLQKEIMKLFQENWNDIYNGTYKATPQVGEGTYHTIKDLQRLRDQIKFEYGDNIAKTVKKFHKI